MRIPNRLDPRTWKILRWTWSASAAWIAASTLWAPGAFASSQNWKEEALKLDSENAEDVDRALQELQRIPDLDRKLSQAVEGGDAGERTIALRTIQTLQRDSLYPLVLQHAKRDTDRFVFLTFCSLAREKNASEIVHTLEERLSAASRGRELTAGAKTAILQCFRSLPLPLSGPTLDRMAKDPNSEVKIAAIDLAGSYATERNDPRAIDSEGTLLQALRDQSSEIRLRALEWIDQRPKGSSIRQKLQSCLKDKNAKVRDRCREIAAP